MKTFTQFIAEVKKLRFVKMYHGTSTSSADKIKKSGFNTPEVYASTSKEIAKSFGNRKGEDSKVVSFRVPKKDIKNEPPGKVVKTDGQRGVDDWGRKHYSTAMNPDYAKKHISKERPGVIDSPKIGRDFRDRYFKNNPNSRFKRRTRTQPKPKTVEEARRMRVLNLIHSTSRENKKKIQDSGFKDSPSTGSYGQGVYTSPSRRVTRDYGHSDVNLRIVNPKVHSTDSPKDFRSRMKKWITTSSDDDLVKNKNKPVDPRKQAKAAIESGKKIVRVPNAHENPTKNVASGSYVIVDKDTANKSIVKNPRPTFRASNKPRRTQTQPKKK